MIVDEGEKVRESSGVDVFEKVNLAKEALDDAFSENVFSVTVTFPDGERDADRANELDKVLEISSVSDCGLAVTVSDSESVTVGVTSSVRDDEAVKRSVGDDVSPWSVGEGISVNVPIRLVVARRESVVVPVRP